LKHKAAYFITEGFLLYSWEAGAQAGSNAAEGGLS